MPTYSYTCADHGSRELNHGFREQPAACCAGMTRDLARDLATIQIAATDPFRAYDLSPRKELAQVEQQRYVDAPRDRFEAKRLERETGRVYVGDDTSGMSKKAQRAIERHKDRKRAGETK